MTRVPNPRGRRDYPGLNDFETRVVRAYLDEAHPDEEIELRTNVPIGQGKEVSGLPEEFERMAREISRLRADAVVRRGDRVELVEVKPRIRSTGLGQLNLYKLINSPEVDLPPDTFLVLVGTRAHDEVVDPLRQLGIIVQVIPEAQLPVF
jgi:hypothetical protein